MSSHNPDQTHSAERSSSFAIALTGGMASGKTTVSNLFVAHGVPIIDADSVARALVSPGQPALEEIVAAFGATMLNPDGQLDRQRMRARIFGNDVERLRLEAILHPRIRAELLERAQSCKASYCLLAIPLFAESAHAYDWIDRVLVIDVPRVIQLERLMRRDGMTMVYAEQALAAQASRAQRLALADDVIDNAAAPEALGDAVAKLHRHYCALALRRSAVGSL